MIGLFVKIFSGRLKLALIDTVLLVCFFFGQFTQARTASKISKFLGEKNAQAFVFIYGGNTWLAYFLICCLTVIPQWFGINTQALSFTVTIFWSTSGVCTLGGVLAILLEFFHLPSLVKY